MLHSNLKQAFSYKLRPEIITNYDKNLLQITAALLQITAKIYYKLLQKLLQITAALIFVKFKIITNYVKFYYILRQRLVLLQIRAILLRITAGITNCDVTTNYVVTFIYFIFIYFIYPLFYNDNYRIQLYTIKIAKIC